MTSLFHLVLATRDRSLACREWYKLKPYQARAMIEPHTLLASSARSFRMMSEIRVANSTSAL